MTIKECILKDVSPEIKDTMSKAYDLILSGKSTNDEFKIFGKVLEVESRFKLVKRELALYKTYLEK